MFWCVIEMHPGEHKQPVKTMTRWQDHMARLMLSMLALLKDFTYILAVLQETQSSCMCDQFRSMSACEYAQAVLDIHCMRSRHMSFQKKKSDKLLTFGSYCIDMQANIYLHM